MLRRRDTSATATFNAMSQSDGWLSSDRVELRHRRDAYAAEWLRRGGCCTNFLGGGKKNKGGDWIIQRPP
jgi:hypothetical protein